MRVSDYYRLGQTQATLDFVDVILDGDTRLFVDPRAFRLIRTDWSAGCVDLIQEFFTAVLAAIRDGDEDRARWLLLGLNEPNETHLGLSSGNRARGRGVGELIGDEIYESLRATEAAATGLLEDLEDTALLVEGVGPDRISDITTNIIRVPLIEYTIETARKYGIPLEETESGPLWNPKTGEWETEFVDQPMPNGERLLLVPKAVVRYRLDFDPGQYYRRYVLSFLQSKELERRSPLVRTLKDGSLRVYKKDVEREYKKRRTAKRLMIEVTRDNPDILKRFRADKKNDFTAPLDLSVITDRAGAPPTNWKALLSGVTSLAPGSSAAHQYHDAVLNLLTALMYPSLIEPHKEQEIDEGIKRVDIYFVNTAAEHFFRWFQQHYGGAPYIPFECKNYTDDVGNPEVDQLAGRFGKQKGRLGFLVCREFKDRPKFVRRCRALVSNMESYVVGLDDSNLTAMVNARRTGDDEQMFRIIRSLFDEIIV
jgi:hypothetical protein